MRIGIKDLGKSIIYSFIKYISYSRIGEFIFQVIMNSMIQRSKLVHHNNQKFQITIPNLLCKWRAETFIIKEPETLEWIDSFPSQSILWDIGANIGLYSIYAAKAKGCKVFAFEPSVFNLEFLARNIYLNDLSDEIIIVPLAVSDDQGYNKLRLTTTEWGGALSTFSQKFGWDGLEINCNFKFQTLGLSLNYFAENLEFPFPDFIKLDVDGLEHFILKGGSNVLYKIKGILIEINNDFRDQSLICNQLLTEAGLTLQKKNQSEMMSNPSKGFQNSYNQIWYRQ